MQTAIAVFVGMLLGIFSGLVPGIHSNTVASVIANFPIPPDALVMIVAAAIGAHLVFQFLPSIFLSIPDDTVVASVLPGHRMALEGRGKEAVLICAFAVLASVGLSLVLLPLAIFLLPAIYSLIEPHMAAVLALASLFLILSEKEGRKVAVAAFVFLLAGALGLISMRAPINDVLFPAFSGLFAASGILLSFAAHRSIPKQKEMKAGLDFLPYVLLGVAFGMLSDLLPGIAAPAQIAVFASALLSTQEPRKFLALVASIAASHLVFAFGALVSIGKAREGAIAIANEISPITAPQLPQMMGALLLSVSVSAFALLKLSRHIERLHLENLKKVNLLVLAYLLCAVALISGAGGLLVFSTSTAIGMLPPLLGIRRTHVMGLIIVPSIILYS
ncbi:MAG: tripartite tricarboxylate transporter permease [Candidatus Micrarchaeota archaeon]|nr:tripartite tricarboxylate transporter permease [Candidatus Micrarchaeota archaeon]